MRSVSLLAAIGVLSGACLVHAAPVSDWTNWRGPDGTGFAPNSNPPTEWSETKNIRWKVEIPGGGYASPIVVGDRIYLMTAVAKPAPPAEGAAQDVGDNAAEPLMPMDSGSAQDGQDDQGRRGGRGGQQGRGQRGQRGGGGRGQQQPLPEMDFVVLALDRSSGASIWQTIVRTEKPHEGAHPTGSFAPGSAIVDGDSLYAFFGSRGLYALDLDGNVKWEVDLGDMRIRNSFGEGATPAVHGDALVVPWDHEGDSFVVALNKTDGTEIWRQPRDESSTWATPVIAEVNGRAQAILPGTNNCISYNLATGEEVWRSQGLTANVIPTPILAGDMCYLMSGFRGSLLLAVNLPAAKGDISESEAIVWTHDRATPYVPSGMLYGEYLYFLGSNNGILSCLNAATGEALYAGQRIEQVRNVYASIVGAGGNIYVCGREGECAVIAVGPTYLEVAVNKLDEGINATPAIVGDALYIRGDKHLYCIAETTAAPE